MCVNGDLHAYQFPLGQNQCCVTVYWPQNANQYNVPVDAHTSEPYANSTAAYLFAYS